MIHEHLLFLKWYMEDFTWAFFIVIEILVPVIYHSNCINQVKFSVGGYTVLSFFLEYFNHIDWRKVTFNKWVTMRPVYWKMGVQDVFHSCFKSQQFNRTYLLIWIEFVMSAMHTYSRSDKIPVTSRIIQTTGISEQLNMIQHQILNTKISKEKMHHSRL